MNAAQMEILDPNVIIIGVILGIFNYIAKFIFDAINRRRGLPNTVRVMAEIQACLNGYMEETAGNRVSFIVATVEHSGEDSLAGVNRPWFITVFLDATNPPLKSVKLDYEDYRVDLEYRKMLIKLREENVVRLETKNLKGMLRNVYEPHGIEHSEIHLIEMGVDWCTFISINYLEGEEDDRGQEQEKYILTNKLRRISLRKVSKNIKFHNQTLK
jgi:hypothetical protein